MFAVLLLASSVASEWVEISQYNYRKEPSRRVPINEDTAANRIYTNYTLTERPWNQGVVARIPNRGNVKRVQVSKANDYISNGKLSDRVSSDRTNMNRGSGNSDPVKEPDFSADHFENSVKRKFTEGEFQHAKIDEKSKVTSQALQDRNIFKETDQKESQKIENYHFNNGDEKFVQNNRFEFQESPNLKSVQTSGDYLNFDKHATKSDSKLISAKNGEIIQDSLIEYPKNKTLDRVGNSIPEDVVPAHKTVVNAKHWQPKPNSSSGITVKENNEHQIQSNKETATENSTKYIKDFNSQRKNKDDGKRFSADGDAFHQTDNKISNSSKSNTVEVIWKLMKVVTDNISRNTRRSFRSKVRYLEDLRNSILSNIEERIERAWPEEGGGRGRRSPRGHVEFPSSESALMTISFLTFAVFLIKLVLQVIHTYKNKTMMVTPAVVAAVGRAAATLTQPSPDN